MSVEPGEVHALLGANGAGKSTLVKILTGVIGHDAGRSAVNGEPLSVASPVGARRSGFAPVFQDPALVPDLSIASEPPPHRRRHRSGATREWLREMELDIDLTARRRAICRSPCCA